MKKTINVFVFFCSSAANYCSFSGCSPSLPKRPIKPISPSCPIRRCRIPPILPSRPLPRSPAPPKSLSIKLSVCQKFNVSFSNCSRGCRNDFAIVTHWRAGCTVSHVSNYDAKYRNHDIHFGIFMLCKFNARFRVDERSTYHQTPVHDH